MDEQEHPHAISWEAMEFIYKEKTKDWYWVLWIVFITIGVIAYFSNNYTFAILIMLSAFVFSLLAAKRPAKLNVVIDDKHIHVGNKKYKTDEYTSYNLIEDEKKLIIRNKKPYVPVTVIPLGDATPIGKLKTYFDQRKIESDEELSEPPLELMLEKLGF